MKASVILFLAATLLVLVYSTKPVPEGEYETPITDNLLAKSTEPAAEQRSKATMQVVSSKSEQKLNDDSPLPEMSVIEVTPYFINSNGVVKPLVEVDNTNTTFDTFYRSLRKATPEEKDRLLQSWMQSEVKKLATPQ
jgi:hypothetical protein